MTKEQIQKLIKDNPGAINMVPSSHLGDLPDLVEAHAEIFTLRRKDTVKMYDKDGSSFMLSANAIKGLALAAGASSYNNGPQSRKEGPVTWVGNAQFYRMGPDGKNEDGPACEKEWDADLQLEKLRLTGKKRWDKAKNGYVVTPYSDEELNIQKANFITTGRERANTGAQSRAIMGLLGQPRALKGLFSETGDDDDICQFIVSRIIWNTKNKMLAERMLDNMAGNVKALYGSHGPRAIEGTVTKPAASASSSSDDFANPEDFSAVEPGPEPTIEDLRKAALQDLITTYKERLNPRGLQLSQEAIDNDDPTAILHCLKALKPVLEGLGVRMADNLGVSL